MAEAGYSALKGDSLLLHYVIREPRIPVEQPPMVIMLHSFGSNERNPFAYAPIFPDEYIVVSARAPFMLGLDSYAWFNVDITSVGPVIDAGQAEKSRIVIKQFISQVTERYRPNPRRICLAGFSQGGIMSASVGLTSPEKVKAIGIISGRILEEVRPLVTPSPLLRELKVFISHGINDKVVNIDYAQEALLYLRNLGLEADYQEYTTGHGAGAVEAVNLVRFLGEAMS